mgnify:CR=1 FL=1
MTEQTATGEVRKQRKDELIEIAGRKLQEKRTRVKAVYPESTVKVREPGVAELVGAHYEKIRLGLEEGSNTRAVVDGLERMVYDGAKVANVAVQGADFIIGGLLVGHGVRGAVSGLDKWKLFNKIDLSTGLAPGMARRFGPDAGTVLSAHHPIEPNRFGGIAKLLGGIGVFRYGPATMVARTALNMTL